MMHLFNPREWSISTRLALWYGASMMVLLAGFTAFTYVNLHRSLHRDFDQHLAHEKQALLAYVEYGESGFTLSNLSDEGSVAYRTEGVLGTYVRLLDVQGRILYESPNLAGHVPLLVMLPAEPVITVSGQTWDAGPIRSHYHPLISSAGTHTGWLEVSGVEWSLHQDLDRLIRTFLVGVLASCVLAFAGGFLLARRALRPVASITRAANEIGVRSLDRRVPIKPGVQDELTRLGDTINNLLDRIEASFHRERRFSANAAHELVTPLAAIRGELELALRSNLVSAHLAPGLQMALGDIDRMNAIIRSLLQISSAERLRRGGFSSLDMRTVVLEHLSRFEDRAAAEDRTFSHSLSGGCLVSANRDGLAQIADNLFDNALKYTNPGGQIHVDLRHDSQSATLTVTDDGIGFGTEDGAHLFDRFYRANTTSVKERVGSGLGLAIVEAATTAFGGSVSAHSAGLGAGSRISVTIPLASREAGAV